MDPNEPETHSFSKLRLNLNLLFFWFFVHSKFHPLWISLTVFSFLFFLFHFFCSCSLLQITSNFIANAVYTVVLPHTISCIFCVYSIFLKVYKRLTLILLGLLTTPPTVWCHVWICERVVSYFFFASDVSQSVIHFQLKR